MQRMMRKEDGVALAAPQVGLRKRLFVVARGELPHDTIINPSWVPSDGATQISVREGCLSLPGVFLDVSRWDNIEVEYQDLDGVSHKASLSGFGAQIFQHETDHLDGVLMVDRLN